VQDEWKILDTVTVNYGARFDVFSSSFDDEWESARRVNLIWQPTDSTNDACGLLALLHAAAGGKCSRQHSLEIRQHIQFNRK